ncbi:nucleoside-diphosphate kinase [Candidatus Campbellbacteria bacterium CG22_combo_CG10-13_8_21_14_all_36_13]|uniref:nucleoside-diphosphate kinase n=1 Tax=Candidatus Campbellbacteria bacterium CG22_combo_CG10-13_8_21_14_all_36_13 TaxID=1974529 RepID=A0A2H0DZ51_9BACT|nr:MAG: nucleoside-diphosphate kinase [Candidatus Campbellbacteria bacterium CG22_combo_CG10-13_8_21_14_all_36_13]
MSHFKEEKTLVIIKPDGIQRSLIGEVIKRYERVGLKIVAMKFFVPTEEQIEIHYTVDPNWKRIAGEKSIIAYEKKGQEPPSRDPIEVGEKVLSNLKRYMTSGPVLAFVLEGAHAVGLVRKLTGGTEPLTSDVGTIRGDYMLDSYQMADADSRAVRNVVHASGTVEEANMEIPHWFKEDEIIKYNIVQEKILYDVNLDGILE